jgi:hypothetical protein
VPLTVLNVRRPVRVDGKFASLLVASVSVSQLSALLAETSQSVGGEVFVLYDQRFVLAYRSLENSFKEASLKQPLPAVEAFGDPVLKAYLHTELGSEYGGRVARDMGIRIVATADGEAYPQITRRLKWFGDVPCETEVYFRH